MVNFDSMMPRDPFADDPNDPASFLAPDEPIPPLSPEERSQLIQELAYCQRAREVLTPKGIMGICFLCEDCDDMHYYDWDIMAENMRAALAEQPSPVHEPSAQPDPDRYVPWEYCLGYLDGMDGR